MNVSVAGAGKCCHPHLLSAGVSTCWFMWVLRGGSCSGPVGRNQLWHSCTNGPFTGRINQAAPSLGHCPESTVWRESHLTPVHWLKGASIITVQRSPCHLLSLPHPPALSPPVISALFLFPPPGSPPPLVPRCSLHAPQLNRLPSGGCGSEEKCHIVSCCWPCAPSNQL